MRRATLSAALLLCASAQLASAAPPVAPTLPVPSKAAPPLPVFRGSSFAELESFVTANRIDTLEDLLPRFSRQLRASFVLVRDTQSLQRPSSPAAPRAILFGADARFVVAFNAAADSLEVIEQRKGSGHFAFSRIQFGDEAPEFFASAAAETRFKCSSCHGGRPLWGQYRQWAGVYGGDQENIESGSPEDADYRSFLRSAKTHARYGNLLFKCGSNVGGKSKATLPGYIRDEDGADPAFPTCVSGQDIAVDSADPGRVGRRMFQPSEGIGEAFSRLNAERLFVGMKARTKDYAEGRYALLAVELGCAGDKPYIPSYRDLDRARSTRFDAAIREHHAVLGAAPRSLQHSVLGLLGIDIEGDVRLDILRPNSRTSRPLGQDFHTKSAYSPNVEGRMDDAYYPNYNDASDYTTDLIGLLVLRDIWHDDAEVRTLVGRALDRAAPSIARPGRYPGGGHDGIFREVRALLDAKDVDATEIPKYLDRYFFEPLMKQSAGPICALVTRRALAQLPRMPQPRAAAPAPTVVSARR